MQRLIDFDKLDAEEILKLFGRLDGIQDLESIKQIVTARNLATVPAVRSRYVEALRQIYNRLSSQVIHQTRPFLKLPEPSEGEITLGNAFQGDTTYNLPVKVSFQKSVHIGLIAKPGMGKTVILYTLCDQIDAYNQSVTNDEQKVCRIVIDKRKDFRGLTQNQITLDARYFPLPLAPPPNVDFNEWLSELGQLLASVWGVFKAGRNRFMNIVFNLWKSSHEKRYPSWFEVRDEIKRQYESYGRKTNRELEGSEILIERLDSMIRDMQKAMSFTKAPPLDQFIDSGIQLVVEAPVNDDNYAFVVGYLQLWIALWHQSNNIRGTIGSGGKGGVVLIIDEASLLYDREKKFSELRRENGIDPVTRFPMTCRDARMLLILASQRPLAEEVNASLGLKIVGNCGHYDDMNYLARAMGDPELVKIIPKLGRGEFLFQYAEKPAALIETTDRPVQRIDDATIMQQMKPFYDAIFEMCKEDAVEEEDTSTRFSGSEAAKRMLFNIAAFPDWTITQRYQRLGLENRNAQAVVRELVDGDYVIEVKIKVGRTTPKFLALTQKSLNWLRTVKNVENLVHTGKLGAEHAVMQQIVITKMRREGWNTWHDRMIPPDDPDGKLCDIYCESGQRKAIIEIAVHPDVDTTRLAKALEFANCTFLCKDRVVLEAVQTNIRNLDKEKIDCQIFGEWLSSFRTSTSGTIITNTTNTTNTRNGADAGAGSDGEKSENGPNPSSGTSPPSEGGM